MAQKLKMVSLKVEPRQTENLKTISKIKNESQSEILRNWIDKELQKNILDIVSESGQEIEVFADDPKFTNHFETIETDAVNFELAFEIYTKYYPPEPECDNAYEFEVLSYKTTLLEITDENGKVEIPKNLERAIEKGFNKNLTFNIIKKH